MLCIGVVVVLFLVQKNSNLNGIFSSNKIVRQTTEEKVIKAADVYVCERLGQDFCQRYVTNDVASNRIAADKSVYYLNYKVSIPEKGIVTSFQITQTADLSKPLEIDYLPNCVVPSECNFLRKSEIETIVHEDMNKYGIKNDQASMDLKFENYSAESPSRWLIYYKIPQEKTPQCQDFKMGGEVYMEISALSGKAIESKFYCSTPGT